MSKYWMYLVLALCATFIACGRRGHLPAPGILPSSSVSLVNAKDIRLINGVAWVSLDPTLLSKSKFTCSTKSLKKRYELADNHFSDCNFARPTKEASKWWYKLPVSTTAINQRVQRHNHTASWQTTRPVTNTTSYGYFADQVSITTSPKGLSKFRRSYISNHGVSIYGPATEMSVPNKSNTEGIR